MECSGHPGGKWPDRWMVGPDRYYAVFGHKAHGKQSWRVADNHCSSRDAGGAVGGAQLAIPYSLDDAGYMKHMEYVFDTHAWVGRVFMSEDSGTSAQGKDFLWADGTRVTASLGTGLSDLWYDEIWIAQDGYQIKLWRGQHPSQNSGCTFQMVQSFGYL